MTVLEKPQTRFAKKLSTTPQKQSNRHSNRSIGTAAELRVSKFLASKNYRLVAHHVQCGHQELDLVVVDCTTNELVFVEVKYRASKKWGSASVSVDYRKLQHLKRAIHWYLVKNKWQGSVRIDSIAITAGKLEHYKNITWY